MKIYSLKRMSIPKIAVLATGLAAAVLVATINPQAAQAQPRAATCAGCHGVAIAGITTATPSTTTPAAGETYTVAITLTRGPAGGNTGYGIVPVAPDTASTFGGGFGSATAYTGTMTAPAAAGTYSYTVWTNQGGPPPAGHVGSAVYTITVGAAPTTVPPTTVPPTTVPPVITAPGAPTGVTAIPGNGLAVVSWTPSTTGDPATSYTVTASPGGRTVTTTGTSATVTGLTNGTSYTFTVTAANSAGTSVVSAASAAVTPSASITGVVPVGAPSTGAGGASTSGDSPLMGLGGLALLLAGAAMVPAIRRRRRV